MSRIQSIIFNRKFFSLIKARNWLRDHGFKYSKVDTTKNFYRFRQIPPLKSKSYRAVEITPGIMFIFEI